MTPYNCTGQEQSEDVDIYDPDGNWVNGIRSSECFAAWFCLNYMHFGMYPDIPSLTYVVRVRPPPPPDPLVDEPEDPPA